MANIPDGQRFIYENSPTFSFPNATKTSSGGSISGPIDKGYFVNPPYPDKEKYANATLSFTHTLPKSGGSETYMVPLWISDIELGMSLSGSTAQSKMLRQFYAHNINLPEMIVTVQAKSSYEYSYIAEFIRFTQIFLTNNYESSSNALSNLITFTLDPYNQSAPNTTDNKFKLGVSYRDPGGNTPKGIPPRMASNGNSMGNRQGFSIKCYITNVSRMVEVGTNAYEFQFAVTIVDKVGKGLPFSSNDPAINSIEGNQWTYNQIDLAPPNFFVQAPSIRVVQSTKPHRGKGGKGNTPGNVNVPSAIAGASTTISSVAETLISSLPAVLNF